MKPHLVEPLAELEIQLCYLDKYFNSGDSVTYYKDLKKRIRAFKKEVYSQLSAEDKVFIKILDKYPLTKIDNAIKININDMNDIMKQKYKSNENIYDEEI